MSDQTDFYNCVQMEKIIDEINSGKLKRSQYQKYQKILRNLADDTRLWSKSCSDKFDTLEEQGFFNF